MVPALIKQLIETGLPNTSAFIDGDDGQHFTAAIVSPAFIGKNRVQKQQMVYATLKPHLADGSIHAISIKTYTPEEWDILNK